MTKLEKKKQAIEYRKQGYSMREISKLVQCSKSTISLWVRDVKDFPHLIVEKKRKQAYVKQGIKKHLKYQKKHEEQKSIGKQWIKENKPFFRELCLLYWGDGSKTKGIGFSNMDYKLLIVYKKLIKNIFCVEDNEFSVHIAGYKDNKTDEELKEYWSNVLEIPKECFSKTTWIKPGESDKYPYGAIKIANYSVEKLNIILGGMEEIFNSL